MKRYESLVQKLEILDEEELSYIEIIVDDLIADYHPDHLEEFASMVMRSST